jgi:sulfofructose kinase
MAEILGLGGVCVDRIGVVSRMPNWDEVEHISTYTTQQGGIVATAMAAVARLGCEAEFIGGVGDDDAGQYVLRVFQEANIQMHRVRIFPKQTTAFSFILVHSISGHRTIFHYQGVKDQFDLGIPTIDLTGVRFLHLDGYWFQTALQTAKQAKAQGITVTLDPGSQLYREPEADKLFPFVDYFASSYAFATRLTGEYEPFKAADMLMKYGSQAVILTKGEDGCFISTTQEHYHVPAFQVSVVDTTGAGDTFHGAFLVGLHKGYDLRRTVQFASAVAALKCTKLGGQAGIPTFEETQEFLKNRGIDL